MTSNHNHVRIGVTVYLHTPMQQPNDAIRTTRHRAMAPPPYNLFNKHTTIPSLPPTLSPSLPANEVEMLQMLLVGHPGVSTDLHTHLVDARVLEQREVRVEEPGRERGTRQRGAAKRENMKNCIKPKITGALVLMIRLEIL